jgi:pyruvate/2-oxoglutarate dehydrogenase complex dihydrolipoamide acyltransferase (E2) component
MKHLIFWLFTGLAAAAWAQQPAKETAKPEPAKEAAKPEPMKEAAKPEPATKKAAAKGPRRWNEDARHCLERGSNTEVIKCAEEFL